MIQRWTAMNSEVLHAGCITLKCIYHSLFHFQHLVASNGFKASCKI